MLTNNKHKYEHMNTKIIKVRCQSLRIINILFKSLTVDIYQMTRVQPALGLS